MNNNNKPLPLLVPSLEAARMLSIGESTFWREVKKGTLPAPVKIAGSTRWRVSDLHRCIGLPAASPPTTA